MLRHPHVYTLIVMVLAAVAVGTVLLGLYSRGPLPPAASPTVTISAPPLLYNPDTFYEEQQPPPPPPVRPAKPRQRPDGAPALVTIIIDDVGLSRSQTEPVIALPPPIAMAFLPYGDIAPQLATRAAAAGHTVMLHMPMMPKGGQNPGPNALVPGLTADEVKTRVETALSRIPEAIGLNNHMGSAATADQDLMTALMQTVKERGIFFLDSYTTPQSVAYQTAQAAGITSMRRDVFLDNNPAREAIDQQLQRLEHIAQVQGHAIAIGHPYPSTLAALHAWLGGLDNRGIKLVSIKELMEMNK